MTRRGGIALAAALLLSACAFGSEEPLFNERDAAYPFAEGQVVGWRERPTGDAFNVRFDRNGELYRLVRVGDPDEPMDVLFVAIRETPEDDYVAQLRLGRDESSGILYAFLWRDGDGYRVFTDPRAVSEGGAAQKASRYCRDASGSDECAFERASDVIGYYRTVLHPRFVAGDATPTSYLDLGAPVEESTDESKPQK